MQSNFKFILMFWPLEMIQSISNGYQFSSRVGQLRRGARKSAGKLSKKFSSGNFLVKSDRGKRYLVGTYLAEDCRRTASDSQGTALSSKKFQVGCFQFATGQITEKLPGMFRCRGGKFFPILKNSLEYSRIHHSFGI